MPTNQPSLEESPNSPPPVSPRLSARETSFLGLQQNIAKAAMSMELRQAQRIGQADELVLASQRAIRGQHLRYQEAQLKGMGVEAKDQNLAGEPVGDILIDSPQTEHHYHPAAPAALAASKLWPVLAATGLAAATGLGGWLIATRGQGPMPQSTAPAPINTTIQERHGFTLELVPPEKPK